MSGFSGVMTSPFLMDDWRPESAEGQPGHEHQFLTRGIPITRIPEENREDRASPTQDLRRSRRAE
jgi:hypothetical protein